MRYFLLILALTTSSLAIKSALAKTLQPPTPVKDVKLLYFQVSPTHNLGN